MFDVICGIGVCDGSIFGDAVDPISPERVQKIGV